MLYEDINISQLGANVNVISLLVISWYCEEKTHTVNSCDKYFLSRLNPALNRLHFKLLDARLIYTRIIDSCEIYKCMNAML